MTTPKAPKHLSAEARTWWDRLQNDYAIEDQSGRLILQTALEAFDRMRGAQKIVEKHGATFLDRFGQVKANPATTIERDSRAQMLSALKALNLDVEPVRDTPGRPPGK